MGKKLKKAPFKRRFNEWWRRKVKNGDLTPDDGSAHIGYTSAIWGYRLGYRHGKDKS
jgi:hypothetical protein